MDDVLSLQQLISEYGRLRRLHGYSPQSRGRKFNELIADMLTSWGIPAQASLRAKGEIDVVFTSNGVRYVLEAKWTDAKADTGQIAKLQKRVLQRMAGTCGVFMSMSGYSQEALDEVADGQRLEVLLLDGSHFEAMLSGLVPPGELLSLAHDRAAFRGDAYAPLSELVRSFGSLPTVEFETPTPNDVIRSGVSGMNASVVLSQIGSRQLGIAVDGDGRLLVTTELGIISTSPPDRTVDWAVSVSDCHRNSVPCADGSVIFMRRNGVGRAKNGTIEVLAGGFPGNTCLVKHPDESVWVFSNGEYGADEEGSPSITRISGTLGEEERHSINLAPATTASAAWADHSKLIVVGSSEFAVIEFPSLEKRTYPTPQSNVTGVLPLGQGAVLTVRDSLSLGVTSARSGTYSEIAQIGLRGSVCELSAGRDGSVYLAAYTGSRRSVPTFSVVKLNIPDDIHDRMITQIAPDDTSEDPPTNDGAQESPTIDRPFESSLGYLTAIRGGLPASQSSVASGLVDADPHTISQQRQRSYPHDNDHRNFRHNNRNTGRRIARAFLWMLMIFMGMMEIGAIGAGISGNYKTVAIALFSNLVIASLFVGSILLLRRHRSKDRGFI